MHRGIFPLIVLFLIAFPLGAGTSTPITVVEKASAKEEGVGNVVVTNSSIKVYISPSRIYSLKPSFVFVKSKLRPVVNVTLRVEITTGKGVLKHTYSLVESYSLKAIPIPWAPQWYMVPVPGLPAMTTDNYSVKSRVNYTIVVGGSVVAQGFYTILEEQNIEKLNLPPLVYAFVGQVFNDTELVAETWGLSPRGWSLKAGTDEEIYVLVADDSGVGNVTLEYRTSGKNWTRIPLIASSLLEPITTAIRHLREKLLQPTTPVGEKLAPTFPVRLLIGRISGQRAGDFVEYRAYAVDINGSLSYSPHGIYYIDRGEGLRILIIDPWVPLWALTRTALDYKPVVAVDLAHGENNKRLADLVSEIDFAKWIRIENKITPKALQDADILIIGQPQNMLTEEELEAIVEWFKRGGKIVWIAGDSDYRDQNYDGPASQEVCNIILARLGSHLRLETAGVYDDANNIGGRSYRVLGLVKPDIIPGMYTRILSAGISRPILFHGPTAIIWVDENNKPHDPVKEVFPGLVRIVWTAETARIKDNNPPPPLVYDPNSAKNRKFVLMAAEELHNKSLVIVSGETPYGGFEPISSPEYMGVELDGLQLVRNTILWATLYSIRHKYLSGIEYYNFPQSNITIETKSLIHLVIANIVNFHHWEYLGEIGDIYVAWPSPRMAKLLEPILREGFEPNVIILSNLGLGLNATRHSLLNWDLRDIIVPEEITLLDKLVHYVKETHSGIIATHSTLGDLIIWTTCDARMKIGPRGHIGYSLSDITTSDEKTVAAMLGLSQLALWEYVRDQIAYYLCSMGREMGPTLRGAILYATGILVGSTPLQLPYIPWSGELTFTPEGKVLGWKVPDKITIYVPNVYKKQGYQAYTEIGWQIALPRAFVYSAVREANNTFRDMSILYTYLSAALRTSNYSVVKPFEYSLRRGILRLLYDAVADATYTQEGLRVQVNLGALNSSLQDHNMLQLNLSNRIFVDAMLRLLPVKIVALSDHAEAAIIAYDKYWDRRGYRSIYFTFEVEASPNEAAKLLLLEAVKWTTSWKYLGPLALIEGKLLASQETKRTYQQILGNISGTIVVRKELLLPENGKASLEVNTTKSNTYHIVIVHPTTSSLRIRIEGGKINRLSVANNVTHVTVKAERNKLKIEIRPGSRLALNPAYVTVVEEQGETTNKTLVTRTITVTETRTITVTSTTTQTITESTTTTTTKTLRETTTIFQTKTETVVKTKTETRIQHRMETITQTVTPETRALDTVTVAGLALFTALISLMVGYLAGRRAKPR